MAATLQFHDGNAVELSSTDIAAIQRALESRVDAFLVVLTGEMTENERSLFQQQVDHTRDLFQRIENAEELDPLVYAFLRDGDYKSIDDWMADSDYVQRDGDWFYPDDYADPTVAGAQVDPEGTIAGAIEASGFEVAS